MAKATSSKNKFGYDQFWQLISLSQVYSFILHELAPPTQSALFSLEEIEQFLQQKKSDCPELKKLTQQIKTCLGCIKDLLIFCRWQQPGNELIRLERSIQRVFSILSFKAKQNQVKLIYSANCSLKILTQPFILHLVLSNLVLNAIEAYGKNQVKAGAIRKTGSELADNKQKQRKVWVNFKKQQNRVKIVIQDWAGGMSSDKLNQIFEPFFSSKPKNQHWGLGLTFTKQFVEEKLGGNLKCHSKPGLGTKFTISLPWKKTACLLT